MTLYCIVMVILCALSCSFHLCNLILHVFVVLVVSFFKRGGMWYIGLFICVYVISCHSFVNTPLK